MVKVSFVRSNFDYCHYNKNTSKDPIYILVFVDDILICCEDKERIKIVKESLKKNFSIKDMDEVSSYIAIDIEYKDNKNKMTLSQTKYDLENARLYDTPMESKLRLEQADEINENVKYRNLIGELLYISTRPSNWE